MIGIYMFTNKINGKKYIGQSKNIEKRYYQHSVNAFNPNFKGYNCVFYKAIRKYNMNNFLFEILEECEINQLNEKEEYWIEKYQTNDLDKGYNLTAGGQLTSNKNKTIYQYDLNLNLINTYKNAYDAAEKLGEGFHQSSIQGCASHKPHHKSVSGFIFTYANDDLSFYKKENKKAVIRIDKNGNEKIYDSLKEAAKDSNTCGSNIGKVLKGERKSAGGYKWKEKI